MWDHPRNRVPRNYGVGVDANKKFFVAQMFQPEVEGIRFAGVWLAQNAHAARGFFTRKSPARDFESVISRAVIDHDHMQARIVGVQRSPHGSLNHFFFVVSRNQYRDGGFIGLYLARSATGLLPQAIVHRKSSNKQQ